MTTFCVKTSKLNYKYLFIKTKISKSVYLYEKILQVTNITSITTVKY